MSSHVDSGNESVESESTVNLTAKADRAPSVLNVAVPETSKSNKIKSMEMTLVDAQGNKIQATIPGRYVKDFVDFFREGCVGKLSRFDHALNISGGFRCAQHEYKIVFESKTQVEYVIDLDIDIPFHVFEFMPFAEVTNFVANFDYCFDMIGHLIAYSNPIVDYGKKRISVELEDERADRLKVTLWGEHVDRVVDYMSTNPSYPVVLIVQYVKCKKYYLLITDDMITETAKASVTTNLLNGKIYLDDMTMPDISGYKDRAFDDEIKHASIHRISLMSSISGYTTYEDFISGASLLSLADIKDMNEAGYVVVFGKITGLAKVFDWSYIGCRDCNKKVEEIENVRGKKTISERTNAQVGKGRIADGQKKLTVEKKWMFGNHGPVSAVGAKFKLQVYVMDASGSRIVTLWDRMVYNFINKTAENLREQEGNDYPKVLDELIGKKCLFRLDVSNYNIRNSKSEISVSRVTTESDIIKKYLNDVSEDQEINPEMSTEFYQNLTPTQDSTAKHTSIVFVGKSWVNFVTAHKLITYYAMYITVQALGFLHVLIIDRDRNLINNSVSQLAWDNCKYIKDRMVLPSLFSEILMEDHMVNHSDSSFWSIDYGEYTYRIDIDYEEGTSDNKIVLAGTEWKKLLSDREDILKNQLLQF
ncbi:OLC1v1018666C1 [Oldenlandia corymbosa var. corymbosa]|uniref:OLC1v1018666C1 n=1 Tax=Oldenlandia corymbosa var. corymbosa TaxID=529605 RepID=A0AAV1EC86_OLDCO|nr:OLC1v1018666C1 [Oldenlandia corymbosa var. corymbosa]